MNSTEQLIKIRDIIHSVNHVNLNDDISRPLTIYIMINNEHGINEALTPVAWNDEDEYVVALDFNNYNIRTTPAMGIDKAANQGLITFCPYSEITQLKVIVSEPDFDGVCDALPADLISDIMRENARFKIFKATDPEFAIKERQKTHY